MAGIFPGPSVGVAPGRACNGFTPGHAVIGEGPFYVSPDCSTPLTDCMYNALISEIVAAVDLLGFSFNANRVDNLGQALTERFAQEQGELGGFVMRSGDWMTGPLNLSRDPLDPPEATTKRYVDNQDELYLTKAMDQMAEALDNVRNILQASINGKVSRSGDQMSGALILHADPTVDYQAATKHYVDAASGSVIISPDVPSGVIASGRLWWDSSVGRLFIFYNDGATQQWVEIGGPGGSVGGVESLNGLDGHLALVAGANITLTPSGNNITIAAAGNFLPLAGGTLTGALSLAADATAAMEAVPLQQVNSLIFTAIANIPGVDLSGYLRLTGGALTGLLSLSGNATANLHAVPLQQVNSLLTGYLRLTGGTLTGNLNGINIDLTSTLTTSMLTAYAIYAGPRSGGISFMYGAYPSIITAQGVANMPSMIAAHNGGSGWNRCLQCIQSPSNAGSIYTLIEFSRGEGTILGAIVVDSSGWGGSVSYNTTSDARLKTDEAPISREFAGQVADRLKPVRFRWRAGQADEPFSYGFNAQDVYEVYPNAVTPGRQVGDREIPWQLDLSKLVPVLAAELTYLRQRVAALEGRLPRETPSG